MKTFRRVVMSVKRMYPKIWDHHSKKARRSLVVYWLPGVQSELFKHGMH